MIASMLALDYTNRPTFEKILSDYRNTVFPDYFYTFLSDYVVNLSANYQVPKSTSSSINDPIARSYGRADQVVLDICNDWDGIISAVIEEHDLAVTRHPEGAEGTGPSNSADDESIDADEPSETTLKPDFAVED